MGSKAFFNLHWFLFSQGRARSIFTFLKYIRIFLPTYISRHVSFFISNCPVVDFINPEAF